jgi:hypothetical protein
VRAMRWLLLLALGGAVAAGICDYLEPGFVRMGLLTLSKAGRPSTDLVLSRMHWRGGVIEIVEPSRDEHGSGAQRADWVGADGARVSLVPALMGGLSGEVQSDGSLRLLRLVREPRDPLVLVHDFSTPTAAPRVSCVRPDN